MKENYGGIRLETDDAVRNDPTLDVALVTVKPRLGTTSEFPAGLVSATAAARIGQAFRERDLLTDPIILPVGGQQLTFELTPESGLNYKKPRLVLDFPVEADTTLTLKIDPEHRALPMKLLGGLAAVLITPFVLAK
jgi:hypothetical protein